MFSRKLQAFFYVSHSETVWFRCGNRTIYDRELYVFRWGNVKNALRKKCLLQCILLFFEVEEKYRLGKDTKKDIIKMSFLIFKYFMITVHIPSSASDS